MAQKPSFTKKIVGHTVASALFMIGVVTSSCVYAQSVNPLDRFRSSNQEAQQNQQTQKNTPSAPISGRLPSPTIGGTQQPGLSQADIDLALQNYNFDSGLSVEEQRADLERQAREAAFKATLNGAFPLNTEEILELLDRYRDIREASESRIGGAPNAEIKVDTISLDPGSTPPIIKLSPGHVTTLNIVDVTGEPWPIQDLSWGGNFEIIQPQAGENVVRISPMKAHEVGNLSVRLIEFNTPIIFSLRTNLDEVHYRFDAQIPEMGPQQAVPIISNGPNLTSAAAGNQDIMQILDGTPPSGTEKLDVEGVDARTSAYDVGGQIYVRTPLTLLSPGWSGSMKSADGTTVYQINKSPVLLLSDKGKMVRAQIDFN